MTWWIDRKRGPNPLLVPVGIFLIPTIVFVVVEILSPSTIRPEHRHRITCDRLRLVEKFVELFERTEGRLPKTPEEFISDSDLGLTAEDLCDGWGEPLLYRVPGTAGRPFDLFSKGPDREADTEDDIHPRENR